MGEALNIHPSLNDQQQFRLNRINKIKRINVMLARSKWSSIESMISKALKDNQIIHEDFTKIIDEERNYRELKESIRIIKSQRSDNEKNKLIEKVKWMDIVEIIEENLKSQV